MSSPIDTLRETTAAIIGAGAAGEYHINAQQRNGAEVIIFEPNPERREEVARKFGFVTIARTMEEAIDLADVVHICTPHKYHARGAIASIQQGKPTIVEKPLTAGLNEAVAIYKASKEYDTPVMVGTSFRLTPSFQKIYENVQEGKIGEVVSFETTYLHDMSRVQVGMDWRQSPDRGSFLYGGGSHAVDLNMWLASQPLREVQAKISTKKVRPSYPGDEDFDLSLGYEDGMTGRVWLSAAAPLPEHGSDVKVYGAEGAYRAHNKHPFFESYQDGDPGWTRHSMETSLTIDEMSRIFTDYIHGERDNIAPMPGIEEGLAVMIALHSLDRSSRTGRTERVPTISEVVN